MKASLLVQLDSPLLCWSGLPTREPGMLTVWKVDDALPHLFILF